MWVVAQAGVTKWGSRVDPEPPGGLQEGAVLSLLVGRSAGDPRPDQSLHVEAADDGGFRRWHHLVRVGVPPDAEDGIEAFADAFGRLRVIPGVGRHGCSEPAEEFVEEFLVEVSVGVVWIAAGA